MSEPKTPDKPSAYFTEEEDKMIVEGVGRFGEKWKDIVEEYKINRKPGAIRKRYKRIQSKSETPSTDTKLPPLKKSRVAPPHGLPPMTHEFSFVSIESSHDSSETAGSATNHSVEFATPTLPPLLPDYLSPSVEASRPSTDTLQEMLVELSRYKMKELQQRVLADQIRLGEVYFHQSAGNSIEGKAFIELNTQQTALENAKQQLEQQRKQIKSEQTKLSKATTDDEEAEEEKRNSLALRMEANRVNMLALRKEELDINTRREKLNAERDVHSCRAKLVEEHKSSRFNDHRVLSNRYLLLNLIGKGGFSPVFEAFDLHRLIRVACKIHQPDPSWPVQRKRSYVHHATRECRIQTQIKHPLVVRLYDVFPIGSEDTFCTILEYCNDGDLGERLRGQRRLSEKETRCIIMQVVNAISHLSQLAQPVIHYDLKPSNILFHDGEVKITDFGLSKIMEQHTPDGDMDLTSQGAGTPWYLPPECFDRTKPRISAKVDIWSIGVLCYQMLFGQKPFGHNATAAQLVQQGLINLNSRVQFPQTPKVSAAASDFISQCLVPSQEQRPDIVTIEKHPFLKGIPLPKASS